MKILLRCFFVTLTFAIFTTGAMAGGRVVRPAGKAPVYRAPASRPAISMGRQRKAPVFQKADNINIPAKRVVKFR